MKRKREQDSDDYHEVIKRFKVFIESSRKRHREEGDEDDHCAKRARLTAPTSSSTNYIQSRRDILVYL
jgi:hypothetical protein